MTENGIKIKRVFDAPVERVWREWTEPERFADWFGGPSCLVPLESVSMDVREGGEWRLTMHIDHREVEWHGSYQEVVEPSRLVFTVTDQAPEAGYDLVLVNLRDLGDGRTEMEFEQRGRMTPEQYKAAGAGWGTFFDRIEERLASG